MVVVCRVCVCRFGLGVQVRVFPQVHWGSLRSRALTALDSLCIWLLEITKSILTY